MRIEVILPPGASAATVASCARRAEAFGMHGVWASSFPACRDPFMTLVPAALSTERIQLGVLPVSPYEKHPVKIADSLLTLHDLSQNRAAILIGGLGKSGMQAMRLEPAHRVTAVADCVRILKAASSSSNNAYVGKMFGAGPYSAPWAVSARPPAIYVAANGEQMLRMAGEVADGVMLSDLTEPLVPAMFESLGAGLARAGRARENFGVSNFWAWHIKSNRMESFREARRELVWRGALLRSHIAPFLSAADTDLVESNWQQFYSAFTDRSDSIEGVPSAIVDALIAALTFSGDALDIAVAARRLAAFAAAGLDCIALRLFDDPEVAIELIGEALLPLIRRG